MAPFDERDVEQERWSQLEWQDYELWEKIENRARNRRRIWIGLTLALALLLFSVPVVIDQYPRWRSQIALRKLAQELLVLKREAINGQRAVRIRFDAPELSSSYQVEASDSCQSEAWIRLRSASLTHDSVVLHPAAGQKIDIPGLTLRACYDPLTGFETDGESVPGVSQIAGFALINPKDLEMGRNDRIAVLTLSGPSGEADFE
ncbi:MAG: hypothetical protein AAB425_05635 [Bdellovibrionota bacterium]